MGSTHWVKQNPCRSPRPDGLWHHRGAQQRGMHGAESWLALSSEGHGPKLGLTVREQEGFFLLGGCESFVLFLERREQQTVVTLLGAQNEQLAIAGTWLITLTDIQNVNIPLGSIPVGTGLYHCLEFQSTRFYLKLFPSEFWPNIGHPEFNH